MSGHPNRLRFEGVLTFVDVPSDGPPAGALKHCVILTRAAAVEALPTLIGMAVNCNTGWKHHNRRVKVGIIDQAEVVGDELRVAGYLFALDFPEVVAAARRDGLGMSYELAEAHIEDMLQPIWTITRTTFRGAAILFADRAAYPGTWFRLIEETTVPALAAESAGEDESDEGSEEEG